METISTAIISAVASGLATDAIKAGYNNLKEMIFASSSTKEISTLEQAIAALEISAFNLAKAVEESRILQDKELTNEASKLIREIRCHVSFNDSYNTIASEGSKAVVIGGNAGDVSL